MRQQIIELIINALAERNEYFMREQDVQLYLANRLINSGLFDNVFIEYHVPHALIENYPWQNNIYVDIVVEIENQFYPVEIKYKTQAQRLPLLIFGEVNVHVNLGQHGAQNIGCYDFWKDVKRIELFEQTFNNVNRGIVLFISNDPNYQTPPNNPNVGYAEFSIHNDRIIPANSFLNWNGAMQIANGRPGLTTNHAYHITWNEMPGIQDHHYILT